MEKGFTPIIDLTFPIILTVSVTVTCYHLQVHFGTTVDKSSIIIIRALHRVLLHQNDARFRRAIIPI